MTCRLRDMALGLCCMGLMGCGTPRVSTLDPVIRNYADNARAAYENGAREKAAELYGRAMDRARLVDAPEEAGRNAYNLALCRIAMGQPAEARLLLRQARLLLGKPGTALAKVLVADAEAARLGGQSVEAVAQATAALGQGAETAEIAQAELLLAEIAVEQEDFATGKLHYRKAVSRAKRDAAPAVSARLETVAARLIQASVLDGDAAACLERRAKWLAAAGDYRRVGESLKAAGDAYAATGRPAPAFELLIRAALSMKAAGYGKQALKAAEQAVSVAAQLGDPMSVERAAILTEEMKQ